MPSNHLFLCLPLLLLSPIPPSIRVFSNELALRIRWLKYWSFSISLSNEYSGLISFRMDWFDLEVKGTLKSLLQHHSSKASILRHSASFVVQLSHPYMTTGKTIALTRRTFVGKAMNLLFNMLSRLVITFLPRSKLLLISWLQSPFGGEGSRKHSMRCPPSMPGLILSPTLRFFIYLLSPVPSYQAVSWTPGIQRWIKRSLFKGLIDHQGIRKINRQSSPRAGAVTESDGNWPRGMARGQARAHSPRHPSSRVWLGGGWGALGPQWPLPSDLRNGELCM